MLQFNSSFIVDGTEGKPLSNFFLIFRIFLLSSELFWSNLWQKIALFKVYSCPKYTFVSGGKTFNYNKNGASKALEVFLNKRKSTQKNIASSVYKIIRDVKRNGDKAILKYEKKFNKNKKLKSSHENITRNIKRLDPKVKKSIDFAFQRILLFHKNQK